MTYFVGVSECVIYEHAIHEHTVSYKGIIHTCTFTYIPGYIHKCNYRHMH